VPVEIPGPKGAKPTIVNVDEEAAKVFFFLGFIPLCREWQLMKSVILLTIF